MFSIPVTKIPALIERVDTPILFLGPPGIGKTSLVAEAAVKLASKGRRVFVDLVGEAEAVARYYGVRYVKPDGTEELVKLYDVVRRDPSRYFVFLRIVATQVTPEDLNYPRVHGDAVVSMLPVMLAFLTIPGVHGILFIDELTNVSRDDVASMLFAIVQEGRVGLGAKLSNNVKVVAAGNPDDVSSVARPLPAPLINRFVVVRVSPPSVKEFVEYLLSRHAEVDPTVVAFLLLRGDEVLYKPPEEPETYVNYPTPRSWERVAVEAYKLREVDEELYKAVVEGLLGPRVGAEFYTFAKLKPPSPETVLRNPKVLLEHRLDARLLAIMMVVDKLVRRERRVDELVEWILRVSVEAPTVIEDVVACLRLYADTDPRVLLEIANAVVKRGASRRLLEVLGVIPSRKRVETGLVGGGGG